MTPIISVAIAHKNTDDARVDSLHRLVKNVISDTLGPHNVCIEEGPGPQNIWSVAMWRKALFTNATHICCLNDDTMAPDFFLRTLTAMVTAIPDKCLALSSEHPKGPQFLAERHAHWYRTRAWVAGWGYCLPRAMLVEFMAWHATLPADVAHVKGEDNLLNEWHGQTGRDTWHPCPTIVQHDTRMLSTYSGQHPSDACKSTVPWYLYPELQTQMQTPYFWEASYCLPGVIALPNEGG